MANVVLRPSNVEMADLGAQYTAVAKSLTHGENFIAIQPGARPELISDRGNAALVVHFLDPVQPPLLNALVNELTKQLRKRSRGLREAAVCGPDGKVFRRIRLNS